MRALHDTNPLPVHTISFFFFNDPATTEIYTLSLHDALPIRPLTSTSALLGVRKLCSRSSFSFASADRKSTRLNSSHVEISYAVFCLKKKKKNKNKNIYKK